MPCHATLAFANVAWHSTLGNVIIFFFFFWFSRNNFVGSILYVASIKWCLPSGILFYGNISPISISRSSLSRFLFIREEPRWAWFFPWPSPTKVPLSLQQQLKVGFLCDSRYHQDESYPFLIPPASRTRDRVLELLLINIESNELTN